MTQEEKKAIVDKAVETAVMAQVRDDVCSRSTLVGLKSQFDFIPEEMVTASASLCGGTGSGSGSCGAYCAGLLAVGLKRNATIEEELADPESFGKTAGAFTEYRERFTKEMGTILCPKIHEKLFGDTVCKYDRHPDTYCCQCGSDDGSHDLFGSHDRRFFNWHAFTS